MALANIAIIKIDKIKQNINHDVLSCTMAVIATISSNNIDKSANVIDVNAFLKFYFFSEYTLLLNLVLDPKPNILEPIT